MHFGTNLGTALITLRKGGGGGSRPGTPGRSWPTVIRPSRAGPPQGRPPRAFSDRAFEFVRRHDTSTLCADRQGSCAVLLCRDGGPSATVQRPGQAGAPVSEPAYRYGPSGSGRAGTRSVGCSPDKPMLLISSSHEKQTAIKPKASRDREFYVNESQ